jgi:maleate cis-trans isomerase
MLDEMAKTKRHIRLGILVPFTNTNLEPDMLRLLPSNISAHFTRIGGYAMDEVPASSQMQEMGKANIDDALQLIAGVRPDLVLYGCTSATLTHGLGFDRVLVDQIKLLTGAKAITAAGALITALQAINATKIGFASPYVGDVNDQAVRFLSDAGFETAKRADIGHALSSHGQGALTPDDVFDLAVRADHPDVDAIVMACTDLRAVEAIARIENALGKPVITSNQAMVFAALKAFGLQQNAKPYGQLFGKLNCA